jgi:hypothetical protein
MRYLHILSAFAAEPWAMQPEKLAAITASCCSRRAAASTRPRGRRRGSPAEAPRRERARRHRGDAGARHDLPARQHDAGHQRRHLDRGARRAVPPGAARRHRQGHRARHRQPRRRHLRRRGAGREIRARAASSRSSPRSTAWWPRPPTTCSASATTWSCTPGGEAGSIGVYGVHEDISRCWPRPG